MEWGGKRVLVCDCEKTMPLGDGEKLAKACKAAGAEGEIGLNTQLGPADALHSDQHDR